MNKEEQRIAIANVAGWTKVESKLSTFIYDGKTTNVYGCGTNGRYRVVPLYLSDLNAMHEAEKFLIPSHRFLYYSFLLKVCGESEQIKNTIHATAAQRAEAFLKTLNLWKESNE
jgi:hypothetical protein